MKSLYCSAFAAKTALSLAIVVIGHATTASGQSPNVQVTSPQEDDSVTVGPGSAKLSVKAKFFNGFGPTWAELIFPIPSTGLAFDVDDDPNFLSPTGEFEFRLTVPNGTNRVGAVVHAYKPGNSGGDPAQTDQDGVEITVTKQ